jgi:polyisoprenoid-binding protein YceI
MRFASSRGLAATALALGLSAGVARADSFQIDPAHSNVNFRVKHLLSKVQGHFGKFAGTFDFDEKAKTGGNLDVTIETASIDTDNDKRDDHLRSPDFFDAKSFPKLTFKSKSVQTDGKTLTINGDLTMRGVTKPVTLKGEFGGQIKDPGGSTKAGFSATTVVNRKDYGINWNKTLDAGGFILGDDVEVELLVEAQNLTADKKSASK